MSISKKDLVAVAKILKRAKEDLRDGTPINFVLDFLDIWFADYFETRNGLFNRGKFIDACELEN